MKKKSPECKRWTPVRRGAVYCSPGCGYDCTHAAYRQAHLDAKALANKLGPGWVPHVWENLGWHYAVRSANGFVKIHPSKLVRSDKVDHYTVFYGPDRCGGDFTTSGPDLRKALRRGLQIAQAREEDAKKTVAAIISAL